MTTNFDNKRIIRVFPRKTLGTPDDPLVAINRIPSLVDEADEVHISVAFTWDLPQAEKLAKWWKFVAPVQIGGPATGQRGEEFVSGKYLRKGFTITSRGCHNKCWFCFVWKRDGELRELPIQVGYNVSDDNILSCSRQHIEAVFSMLKQQPERVQFTGGLEAKLLQSWHVDLLSSLGEQLDAAIFAYDTPDDLEPLRRAGEMLVDAGIITKDNAVCRCYLLSGYPKDSYGQAEKRIHQAMSAGFVPYIMPFRDKYGKMNEGWIKFRRRWHGITHIVRSICVEKRKHLFVKD